VIVDSGILYALLDRRDQHHGSATEFIAQTDAVLRAPMLVVAEVAHLAATRLGTEAEVRFLGGLAAGEIIAEPVHPADWERMAELVARYRDLPLGTVDASLVALAERLGETEVATFDHRDLGIVRPLHCAAFTLLP
jgi:predicted nucleic acid-binding protein